jgi:purine-binding chemotaxis protein CheW
LLSPPGDPAPNPRSGATPMSAAATEPRQLVVFTLDGERYGLAIEAVEEIIRYTPPRTVDSTHEWARGVINLRGLIVPIYDLAARLDVPASIGEHTRIVIVETNSQTIGLIVDRLEEVVAVELDQFESVPTADNNLIAAVAKFSDQLLALLDPNALLAAAAENPGSAG